VRGFGTAVMHGGASAGFAVVSLAILERDERHGCVALLPGFIVAVLVHAAFNRLSHQQVIATAAVMVAVPALVLLAYHHGERTLADGSATASTPTPSGSPSCARAVSPPRRRAATSAA
jgi:protease PrsW